MLSFIWSFQGINWNYPALALAACAAVCAVVTMLRGPSIVLRLMGKYLAKRRIAWVALGAVMLCTTMVLVVISVMGGWLSMFKQSFHGLTGDVIVKSESLEGFPYYQQMIDRIEKRDDVISAVSTIETWGLFNVGSIPTSAVKVMGIPIEKIGMVNKFPDSLYRQHELDPDRKGPPSFALLDKSTTPLKTLPGDVPAADPVTGAIGGLPKGLAGRLAFDRTSGKLTFKGIMRPDELQLLRGLSEDPTFKEAIDALFKASNSGRTIDYRDEAPRARDDPSTWPGMIPGIGVAFIHRNSKGVWESPLGSRDLPFNGGPSIYAVPVTLTVLGIENGQIDVKNKAERHYWIVDTSRTQIWQYDHNVVYVPFEQLQKDLGVTARAGTDAITGDAIQIPARTSQIHVRVKPGTNLNVVRDDVEKIVHSVLQDKQPDRLMSMGPYVETWEDSQRTWLDAIEHEKLLMVFLFAIISLVAIFLIFCIFYMIVVEKTKDIGIIKSVGATSGGVAGIFLGYGLAIGVLGSGLGLLCSFLIVHNINWLHGKLGEMFGVQIWNPEVYLFDKIPNTMSAKDVIIIPAVAVLASVVGALVPAYRAARMNPVEALRWE